MKTTPEEMAHYRALLNPKPRPVSPQKQEEIRPILTLPRKAGRPPKKKD